MCVFLFLFLCVFSCCFLLLLRGDFAVCCCLAVALFSCWGGETFDFADGKQEAGRSLTCASCTDRHTGIHLHTYIIHRCVCMWGVYICIYIYRYKDSGFRACGCWVFGAVNGSESTQ